jgi:hypothetical protein
VEPVRTAVFVEALRICALASSYLPVKSELIVDLLAHSAHSVCVLHRLAIVL